MNLIIRADASLTMGTGHVMRCLALAQAWQDAGGRALFAMAESTPAVSARIAAEQFEAVSLSEDRDVRSTIALARQRDSEWVVLDGYQFTAASQKALKTAGLKVLAVDDCGHADEYSADVVLNQNVSADETLYRHREPHTRLLLGTQYALLRRQFTAWCHWARELTPHPKKLLVMMGGSDPQNVTARVIEALQISDEKLDTTVVVGASNPHLPQLQALTRPGTNIRLVTDPQNLPELMAQADVAISAAGSTCWELCLFGLPALLIDVAPNQTALARELHRRHCAIHVGDSTVSTLTIAQQLLSLLASPECRKTLSQNSRELVDGNGARRVVSVLCGARCLWLRPAASADRQILFEWVNDPAVRAASFSSEPIAWETHSAWFDRKLASMEEGTVVIFIAEDQNGIPIGQIRFELRADQDWEADISLSPAVRGLGLASELIRNGVDMMRKKGNRGRIHALVKQSNPASLRAFERSAFKPHGTKTVAGQLAIHLVYPVEENELTTSKGIGKN